MAMTIELERSKENSLPINDSNEKRKNQVLKISDNNTKEFIYKEPLPYTNKWYFHDDFLKHLQEIILQRIPKFPVINENIIQYFGASCLKRDKSRFIYFYYYTYDQQTETIRKIDAKHGSTFIVGPTFSGRRVFLEVKKQFRKEKWLSDNIMELPLKSKIGMEEMQKVIGNCFDQENLKLFKYIQLLHSKYHANNT